MQIIVNDDQRDVSPATTVAALLESLDLDVARVAVERNRELVPRASHRSTRLADGDRVEIVTLVGGG